MARPDFGKHQVKTHAGGITLECSYVAPGLTMQDLSRIFHEAKAQAEPGDQYAANPAKWPDQRGITAVTDAILDAIYGS